MFPNIHEVKDSDGNSTISVEAEESGFFQCIGYNKLGNDSKRGRFVATGKSLTLVKLVRCVIQSTC